MRTQTQPGLDEVSAAIRSMGSTPRLSLEPGWRLDIQPDRWRVLANGVDDARRAPHNALVAGGMATEHLVVALEARHHRLAVRLLPTDDPQAVADVRAIGSAHPTPLALLMRDLSQGSAGPTGRSDGITPSDLRVLNLTAESFTAEVMWSHELESQPLVKGQQRIHAAHDVPPFATVVTHSDTPLDWVEAGRALARLLLRSAALGLEAHPELQVLGEASTREELRQLWGIKEYPQAQFALHNPSSPAA